jgi:hypothetical protein
MSNENLDQTKSGKTGELNEADLEPVAGGLMGIATRKTPVPEDSRSIAGVPIPEDGRSLTGEPIPEDGKS